MVTAGYTRLQRVIGDYVRLQGFLLLGYTWLQGVTLGYICLEGVTLGYR